jgi:hypothetical protein
MIDERGGGGARRGIALSFKYCEMSTLLSMVEFQSIVALLILVLDFLVAVVAFAAFVVGAVDVAAIF